MTGALGALLERGLGRSGAAIAAAGEPALAGAELIARAETIAAELAVAGLAPHEPVHLTIGNRPDDLAAFLAIWRAGGVAVPIHESVALTTVGRIAHITRARLALVRGAVETIAEEPPPARPLLDGAALVIFTSGTTGAPKGAVIGHDRMAAKVEVLGRLLSPRVADRVLAPLQLTFIYGLWVTLVSLDAGARLTLMPKFSAEAMRDELGDGVAVLAGVPSMLRTLFAAADTVAAPRTLLVGGEPFTPALRRDLARRWPGTATFDLFGLTETGSCDFCLPPEAQARAAGSLGWSTDGVLWRIVGETGAAVPDGETGELQIATPFAMLGYLDQPDLTREAFADGYFRTGDLARRRPDGAVELAGRIKDLISRGGMKIAPLELDTLFASHPDVAGAMAVGVPDDRLGEDVHLVVVPRQGATLDAETLKAWAAGRIERYKLPAVFHFMESLPVGATGKADRRAAAAAVLAARG